MQISPACCSGLLKKSRNPAAINKHSFVAKKTKEGAYLWVSFREVAPKNPTKNLHDPRSTAFDYTLVAVLIYTRYGVPA